MTPLVATLLLLALLIAQFHVSSGSQIALRSRTRDELLSRSLPGNTKIFDPTSEESFYLVGDDPNTVFRTIHQNQRKIYVNFERFEDYLRPQERLCTPFPSNESATLSFPLSPAHYLMAFEKWSGIADLVFIGHDPSCFAPEEERSSYRSESIEFDNVSQTVLVIGTPLQYGDKHFPAPTELIIGRAPENTLLTPRTKSLNRDLTEQEGTAKCALDNVLHWEKLKACFSNQLLSEIDIGQSHINFTTHEYSPHKQYWPPEKMTKNSNAPRLIGLNCLECKTEGAIEQEFHVQFKPIDDSSHSSNRRDEDKHHKHHNIVKNHIKRAFIKMTVTEEIVIRKQFEVLVDGDLDIYCNTALLATTETGVTTCSPAYTLGGLTWSPSDAKTDKKNRAEKIGNKNISKAGAKGFGFTMWPADFGIYVWMNIGIGTELNLTLPGFEVTQAKGSVIEIPIMDEDKLGHEHMSFDPKVKIIPSDVSFESTNVHFNIAVGPKAGINIGIPHTDFGIGLGARVDVVRFDSRFSEFKNVTKDCTAPGTHKSQDNQSGEEDKAMDNAFGFVMDFKTGVYAYLNIAGFYIDTSWLGQKVNSDFPGLYWGVKNLLAKCVDCGTQGCIDRPVNKLLDIGTHGDGFFKWEGLTSDMLESMHVGKEMINSLDNSVIKDDWPNGHHKEACYVTKVGDQTVDYTEDEGGKTLDRRHNRCQPGDE